MIVLERVTKRYPNGHTAVDDLSLEIADGEVCVLVGPSGCGKTTTMRMINRLIEPTAGRITLHGDDVVSLDAVALRRRIGYVIQSVGLFPHLTIAANVATVPRLLGWPRARIRERVDELLHLVGLEPSVYRDRYPAQLSGGQQQRVGVARALGADPPVLLMDEPFGAIDPIARDRLQQEFLKLQAELRKTVVFVTHDVDEAVRLGDRIAILATGGVLAQHDRPADILARPASTFVAEFVGDDRGLTRLALLPVSSADPIPLEDAARRFPLQLDESGRPMDGSAVAGPDSTLKDALARTLVHDGWVIVTDPDGRATGVLTATGIVGAGLTSAAGEARRPAARDEPLRR